MLAPEIAGVLKKAMLDVVNEGTAGRLRNGVSLPGGGYLPVGGKTGTGDHRYKVFGSGGIIIQSKVMNRAATFVFILGDRYFGVMTAFVAGSEAENYEFSSSLPVAILKIILPDVVSSLDQNLLYSASPLEKSKYLNPSALFFSITHIS